MELYFTICTMIVYLVLMLSLDCILSGYSQFIIYVGFTLFAYIEFGKISIGLFVPVFLMGYTAINYIQHKQNKITSTIED